jgi:transcriptional regulator with XRE-family HTH domain
MPKYLTENDVASMLLELARNRTQAALAEEIGVSRSFLNEVIRGNRAPTGEILRFLNLHRKVIYISLEPTK